MARWPTGARPGRLSSYAQDNDTLLRTDGFSFESYRFLLRYRTLCTYTSTFLCPSSSLWNDCDSIHVRYGHVNQVFFHDEFGSVRSVRFQECNASFSLYADSSDIVDCKLKLILGLIWTLILHYSISMPMWDGDDGSRDGKGPTPKQRYATTTTQLTESSCSIQSSKSSIIYFYRRLMGWIQSKIPDVPITNFTGDWNDGRAVGALVDAVAPGTHQKTDFLFLSIFRRYLMTCLFFSSSCFP